MSVMEYSEGGRRLVKDTQTGRVIEHNGSRAGRREALRLLQSEEALPNSVISGRQRNEDAKPYVPQNGPPAYRAKFQRQHDEWAQRQAATRAAEANREAQLEAENRLAKKIARATTQAEDEAQSLAVRERVKAELAAKWQREDARIAAARQRMDALVEAGASREEIRAATTDWVAAYMPDESTETLSGQEVSEIS